MIEKNHYPNKIKEFVDFPYPEYPHKDSQTEVDLIKNMYKAKVQGIEKVFDCDDVFDAIYVRFLVPQKVEVSKDNESQTETITEEEYEKLKKRLAKNCPTKKDCNRCSIDNGDCRLLHGWKKEGAVYKHSYPLLGEYLPNSKTVVLYVKNIDDACGEEPTYKGVLPTYIHELFHAYFHYVTEQKQAEYNYIREIEEAMTEFSTLVFLRYMENEYPLEEWNNISEWALKSIGKKQKTVGNLSAYGFGRYLFDNIQEDEAFNWINKYAERLGYIDENDELVRQYKQMVCHCYPTEPGKCLELLRKILFATKNTLIKPRNVNKNRNNNMKNNAIIESILCLLKGYSVENSDSLKYLLNQSIRAYDILPDHHHLSKGAEDLWKKLMPTTEDIMKYHYQQMVHCKNRSTNVVELHLYTGNNRKTFKTIILKPGDKYKFKFRQVFHEEHVIPVQAILNYLVQQDVNTLNAESIKELLDEKLHICVILKEEDGHLPKIKRESFDYQEIIDKIYEKVAKITLV